MDSDTLHRPIADMRFASGDVPIAVELGRILVRNRRLLWAFTKREIADRYAGHMLGTLWVLGHPFILIGVYVFVFAFVFQVKLGGTPDMPLDYTTYLLAGLVSWLAFQDALGRSCTAVTVQTNLIKNVVFPVEVLPVQAVAASFVTQLLMTALLLIYMLAAHQSVPVTVALLPALFLLQLMLMVGVGFFLSAIAVYLRDLRDIVQVVSVIGMYLMPIFYLPQWVPSLLRPAVYLNPFSHMIWCYQDALYFGRIEHPWSWLVFVMTAVSALYLGYRLFRKLKTSFAGVL